MFAQNAVAQTEETPSKKDQKTDQVVKSDKKSCCKKDASSCKKDGAESSKCEKGSKSCCKKDAGTKATACKDDCTKACCSSKTKNEKKEKGDHNNDGHPDNGKGNKKESGS